MKEHFAKAIVTYKINIFHQILMRVDGSDELKKYDTKTVYVTLGC